jgi:hypothetical protein
LALSSAEKDVAKKHLEWRARHWFELAAATATGETRAKLETYLKDLPPREGAGETKVHLCDLEEFGVIVGFGGSLGKKGKLGYRLEAIADPPITVNGKHFENGLSSHPPNFGEAVVKYRLGKTAQEFRTRVALNDSALRVASPLTFTVFGDGKELWSSKPVQRNKEVQDCRVSVAGVDVLELHVRCPGDNTYAHAVWLDPYIVTGGAGKRPATEDAKEQFVGDWELTLRNDPTMRMVWSISHRKGMWTITGEFIRGREVLGTTRGQDIKSVDGKLIFVMHHVKKVAPNWQDGFVTATVQGDRLDYDSTDAGGRADHATMTRMKK